MCVRCCPTAAQQRERALPRGLPPSAPCRTACPLLCRALRLLRALRAGAMELMAVHSVKSMPQALADARRKGWQVLGE